ncbi:DUF397 domain-containing protein [Streptomyces sp. FH025]|uniref:DUF397 domain-containing protein n=1 Tax=Streptomyces sp. FH025 TaxID=2815937 RepID=UPI001A9DEF7D|nr:DUF397 domain-containing protein [Streptomyces sp. FH025]MBO1417912.1 DUF397 domain-containing protein [Streptomyces sp. FH025]
MLASSLGNVVWRKSGYSGQGGDCIEVAEVVPAIAAGLGWYKSRYSGQGGNCVETQVRVTATAVRDSKDPDGPVLMFPADGWASFLAGVKGGEFPST